MCWISRLAYCFERGRLPAARQYLGLSPCYYFSLSCRKVATIVVYLKGIDRRYCNYYNELDDFAILRSFPEARWPVVSTWLFSRIIDPRRASRLKCKRLRNGPFGGRRMPLARRAARRRFLAELRSSKSDRGSRVVGALRSWKGDGGERQRKELHESPTQKRLPERVCNVSMGLVQGRTGSRFFVGVT
jgi:hypothetical protein